METVRANKTPYNSLGSAFIAIFAMILAFAAAAVPIPMYSTYQDTLGITDFEVSLTIVSYLFGVLATLFVGGKLSDAFGRRPLVCAALLLGMAACAIFALLHDGLQLQAARFIQGISCALTMSATSAFVIDCTSHHHRTLGLTVASTGALIGLTFGSLMVAAYSQISSDYWLLYCALIVCMGINIVLLPLTHETVTHRITLKKAVKPIVQVPPHLRPYFPIAAGAYISAWGIGMFFQSLSTPAAMQYFGAVGPVIPSLILALTMAPSAFGGPLCAKYSTKFAIGLGYVVMYASCLALWVSMNTHSLALYLVLCFVFGVSTGILLSSSMQMLISASSPTENATVVSLINFTGYIGSTALSVFMSALSAQLNLSVVFALVVVVSVLFIIPGIRSLIKHQ